MTFPPVSGGETTVFNQGYFFRNYKVGGHDESDLPVLIQLHEKRGLMKRYFLSSWNHDPSTVIAELRVEAYNYCKYDYYEPLYFCLSPVAKYSDLSFQLKIMFQLVKPSSVFSCSKIIDVNTVKPIALQIDICSARLLV